LTYGMTLHMNPPRMKDLSMFLSDKCCLSHIVRWRDTQCPLDSRMWGTNQSRMACPLLFHRFGHSIEQMLMIILKRGPEQLKTS
jgi:hypothetical protein